MENHKITRNDCPSKLDINPKFQLLLNDIYDNCNKKGINIKLVKRKAIMCDGSRISGYFDETIPIIKVAICKPVKEWFSILIHEYCHSIQWINQTKPWTSVYTGPDNCALTSFENWLCGTDYKDIKKYIKIIQNLELECEKLAIDIIKKYNIPLDINHYIQAANAYIYLYSWLYYIRKWPNIMPYQNKQIVKQMPTRFLKKYDIESKRIYNIYSDAYST